MTTTTRQTSSAPATVRRADARRNVEKVLKAAEQVFSTEGWAVPIDVVATRAGVGVGTVYRHFPTKAALFEAVVVARLEALLDRARQLATASDPGQAVFTFVAEVAELAAHKKDFADEMARAGVDSEVFHHAIKEELEHAFDVLLERAKAAGKIREDIAAADVSALVMGTCVAAELRGPVHKSPRGRHMRRAAEVAAL